jgi:hypothetical protein
MDMDEKIASPFEPDILSRHYFESLNKRTLLDPEKKLMLAVLEDAINCFQHNLMAQSASGKRLFEEAEQWILEKDVHWLFSFESICNNLNINPAYVRRGLLQWKQLLGHPGPRTGERWPAKLPKVH